jgi:hypothetical protein
MTRASAEQGGGGESSGEDQNKGTAVEGEVDIAALEKKYFWEGDVKIWWAIFRNCFAYFDRFNAVR